MHDDVEPFNAAPLGPSNSGDSASGSSEPQCSSIISSGGGLEELLERFGDGSLAVDFPADGPAPFSFGLDRPFSSWKPFDSGGASPFPCAYWSFAGLFGVDVCGPCAEPLANAVGAKLAA